MKRILFIPILSIVAGLFTACGFSGKDGEALTIWQTMDPHELLTFKTIVKKFEKKYPKIKIKVQLVPFNDAREKFSRAAQGGNAPDILRCEIAWTPMFADRGFLKAIERYIPGKELKDYLDAPLNYNKYAGHLWGIPQITDCLALIYNKKILKAAGVAVPKTMERLMAAVKKLSDPSRNRYGIFIPADSYFIQPFIWAFGGGLISNDKKILITEDGSVRGLEFFLKLKKAGMPATVNIATQNKERDEGFKSGKYAMVFQGPWATGDLIKGKEFKDNPDNLGVAVIPRGPGGYGSPVGGHNYVISRSCKRVKDAVAFIRFINSTESQILFARKNNVLPTRHSAYEDNELKKNAILQGFKKQLDLATNRPVIPEGGQIYPDFTRNIQNAYEGKISARKALQLTAQDWSKLLSKK